jgi:rhodanese-related sulfurtransferase
MQLFSILFLSLVTIFQVNAQVQNINQTDFKKLQADKNTVIIDVRTPGEIQQGYIKGTSKFIDINDPQFEQKINSLDKSKNYIMVCRSGARSGRAAQLMAGKGFKKVYNLSGGVLNWSGGLTK